MRKCIVLVMITVLMVSSLITLTVTPTTVWAESTPSVPQFTVKLIDNLIEIAIKDQPFTPYTNASGHRFDLYYIVEVKEHLGENWYRLISYTDQLVHLKSVETVLSLSDSSQVDFRVKAVIAYDDSWVDPASIYGINRPGYYYKYDDVTSSGWSNIQTITINDNLPTSSPPSNTPSLNNPNPSTLNQPNTDNPGLFSLPSCVGVAIVALLSAIVVLLAIIAVAMWRKNVSQFNALNPGVAES
ncbi:MAG: hypothetical protein FWG55_04710 [Candidatus Bathyarchaeota archaeon]|nr:hypothetical protein [Candidatus Termiticorpusculum sp.]